MVYYWGVLFVSFFIFGIIYMIRQTIVYSKYERLKLREDKSYKERKHHEVIDQTYTLSVFAIKEEDKHPVLAKLKNKYNDWVKLWWYAVAIVIGFMIIGGVITLIINLIYN